MAYLYTHSLTYTYFNACLGFQIWRVVSNSIQFVNIILFLTGQFRNSVNAEIIEALMKTELNERRWIESQRASPSVCFYASNKITFNTLVLTNTGSCGNNNKLSPTSTAKSLSGWPIERVTAKREVKKKTLTLLMLLSQMILWHGCNKAETGLVHYA